MDHTYIMPFIKSVQNVFQTMLGLQVTCGQPSLKKQGEPAYDVSGIIGMSGDVEGAVVLSFPTATAERCVALFTGMEIEQEHEDFADAIGELVNMVSGGAKAQFEGKQISISCPSVVLGEKHSVWGSKDVICLDIPCNCDVGEFCVEVSFRQSCLQAQRGTAVAAAGA